MSAISSCGAKLVLAVLAVTVAVVLVLLVAAMTVMKPKSTKRASPLVSLPPPSTTAATAWKWPPFDTSAAAWQTLHASPWVGFCAGALPLGWIPPLLQLARQQWTRSPVVTHTKNDTDDTNSGLDARRTSTTYFLTGQDERLPWIQQLRRHWAQLVGLPVACMETLQLVRYLPGQEYRPHWDYFDVSTPEGRHHVTRAGSGGQRTATMFVYLTDGPADGSGGTAFPELHVVVRPQRGAAILFSNIVPGAPDHVVDARALHAGLPLSKGVKYGCNVWFRQHPRAGT